MNPDDSTAIRGQESKNKQTWQCSLGGKDSVMPSPVGVYKLMYVEEVLALSYPSDAAQVVVRKDAPAASRALEETYASLHHLQLVAS